MAQDIESVREELTKFFSKAFAKSTHFDAFCRIGAYLSSADNCSGALAKLEQELNTLIVHRIIKIRGEIKQAKGLAFAPGALIELLQGVRAQKWAPGGIPAEARPWEGYAEQLFTKLLSEVLGNWEAKSGFDVGNWFGRGTDTVDILLGNPGKLFNDQLENGRPFKDVGAGREHGEFSHRIQWYLLGVGLSINSSGDLYKNVKRWISTAQLDSLNRAFSNKRYLWEYLFDRDGDPSNASSAAFRAPEGDFRGPSNLTVYLLNANQKLKYPWLHWCIKDRYTKREKAPGNLRYLVKKDPYNSNAQAFINAQNALDGKNSTPEMLEAYKALQSGLFIRRGTFITSIDWQNPPKI